MINEIADVIKAIVRACSRVFVKKVKIAPSKEMAIINEIKATIMYLRILALVESIATLFQEL